MENFLNENILCVKYWFYPSQWEYHKCIIKCEIKLSMTRRHPQQRTQMNKGGNKVANTFAKSEGKNIIGVIRQVITFLRKNCLNWNWISNTVASVNGFKPQ